MKIDRLIAMIMVLLERDKINAEDLAKMFEVSVRTIYRDLDAINQAGIPVLALSGPGNGISILKSYKMEKHLFSINEITALLMALGSIQSNLPSKEITTALAKVKGMIPPDKQEELKFKTNQIKIDFSPWLYSDSVLKRMQCIQKALEQQVILTFEYKDNKNIHSFREVEPYCLLLKGTDWYLQGFCLARQDFRTFHILRMNKIVIGEQLFELRQFPAERLQQAHFNDDTLTQMKLRIHEDIVDKMISRFGEDCLTKDGDSHYIASVHMPISELSIAYLLGFGTKCECLEPAAMRRKLLEGARDILQLYIE